MKEIIVSLFICAVFVGCGIKQPPFDEFVDLPKGHIIDSNKDSVIDKKDVSSCNNTANSYFDNHVQQFLTKASVNRNDLFTEAAYENFRNALTKAEWDIFDQHVREYKQLLANTDATAQAVDRIKPVRGSGKVSACQGSTVGLQNGITIKYAGIKMPEGITNNYSMMVSVRSLNLTKSNIISYELTGSYSSRNIPEAYVYCNNLFINEELVKTGYALAIRDGSDWSITLIKLEEEAKQNKRGLWAYIEDNPFAEPLY